MTGNLPSVKAQIIKSLEKETSPLWREGDGRGGPITRGVGGEVETEGVKNVRRVGENRGERFQYIFNLADVIRLCICQERRIS